MWRSREAENRARSVHPRNQKLVSSSWRLPTWLALLHSLGPGDRVGADAACVCNGGVEKRLVATSEQAAETRAAWRKAIMLPRIGARQADK